MPAQILKPLKCATLIFGGLVAISMPTCLQAEEISLDLGGDVKMEFVWVQVTMSEAKKEIKIGDFSNPEGKEPLQKELIWGPFNLPGKGWGYYLGKTEVTEAQWKAVMGEGENSRFPVTNQPYQKIQEFIGKLNSEALGGKVKGLPRKGDGTAGVIRLPTEAEWEYAARGGAGPNYQKEHPYGDDTQVERYEVIFTPGSSGKAREAATLPPNSLGLQDMLGNVMEFVDGAYSAGGSQILRGGSYLSEKQGIRSSSRNEQPPFGKDGKSTKRPDAGFRLSITAPEKTALGQAEIPVEKDPEDAQKEREAAAKAKEEATTKVKEEQDRLEAAQFQKAMDLINAAFTAQQIIQQRTAQVASLDEVNADGFANEKIAKLRTDLAEKTKSFEQSIALLKQMHDENSGAASRVLSSREEQLKKQIASDSSAIAQNAAEAMSVLKNRLGFAPREN